MSYDSERRKARRLERQAEYANLDPATVTKACMGCGADKPLLAFNVSLGGKLGRHARCRECRPAARKATAGYADSLDRQNRNRRERYAADAEYRKAKLDANRNVRYGLRPGQYEEMLADQGGRCAICDTPEPGGHGVFHVDHDHSCCAGPMTCGSCIRGLLCTACNTGIGMLGDDISKLMSAAIYLMTRAGLTGKGQPNLQASVMRSNPVAG